MSQEPVAVPEEPSHVPAPHLSETSAIREEAWEWWLTLRNIARERVRIIAIGFGVGLLVSLILFVLSARVYQAKGVFVLGQSTFLLSSENADNSREPLVNFLASIKTNDMARAVAERVGVSPKNVAMVGDPTHKVDLGRPQTALIDISSIVSSRTAVVKVDSEEPGFTVTVAEALLQELELFNRLAGRLNQIDAEVKLSDAKLTTLNASLSAITAHRIEVEQQIKMLDAHLKAGGELEFAPPFAQDLALIEMQRKVTGLRTSLDAQASISIRGPTLNTLRAATRSMEAQIKEYSNQLALRIRANYSTDVGEETALEQNLLGIQERMDTLGDERSQIIKSIGDSRLRHRLETDSSGKMVKEGSAIAVMDAPQVPLHPYRPSAGLFLVLGFFFGGGLGIGGALLAHFADRRIRTPQQMEFRAGIHCLAVLPESLEPAGDKKPALFITQDEQPGLSFLRNMMMRAAFAQHGERFFVFTRIGEPEDHSIWVARLAIMLAKAQQRTLVVDLDFKHPKIAETLGIEVKKTLVQWFNDDDPLKNYVQYSVLQELAVLHPGKPNEPEEVLVSRRPLAAGLSELGKEWDFILVVSPSVLDGYQLLLAVPPRSIMVGMVHYDRASFDNLGTAVTLCETYGLRFAGVVLHDYPRLLLSGPLASFSLGSHQYALQETAQPPRPELAVLRNLVSRGVGFLKRRKG